MDNIIGPSRGFEHSHFTRVGGICLADKLFLVRGEGLLSGIPSSYSMCGSATTIFRATALLQNGSRIGTAFSLS